MSTPTIVTAHIASPANETSLIADQPALGKTTATDPINTSAPPTGLEDMIKASRKKLLDHYRKENAGMKPEAMFHPLIKQGFIKIVRRRGKPPAIVWL